MLLTLLAPLRIPIVVAGTCDGKLEKLSGYSNFIPRSVSLNCLTIQEAEEVSQEVFDSLNKSKRMELAWRSRRSDQVLSALLLSTSQIPRFIKIATENYHNHRVKSTPPQHCLTEFYLQVREYYPDVRKLLLLPQYSSEVVARILLETQTDQVNGNNISGTDLTWSDLENASLVFPFSPNSYTIPLVFWMPLRDEPSTGSCEKKEIRQKLAFAFQNHKGIRKRLFFFSFSRWAGVLEKVEQLVPGLSVDYLFVSLDDWVKGSANQTWIGQVYERLIAASLAVKYFQFFSKPETEEHRHPTDGRVPMSRLYNVKTPRGEAGRLLDDFYVNLSGGIVVKDTEVKVTSSDLGNALYLNQRAQNSRHDCVLPGVLRSQKKLMNSAFQLKNSLSKPEAEAVKKQLDPETVLFWFYLDAPDHNSPVDYKVKQVKTAREEGRLAFLSGAGSINPCTFEQLKEVKAALLSTPSLPTLAHDFCEPMKDTED